MSSQQHRAGRFLSFFTHERALMFRWIGLGSYQASDSLGGVVRFMIATSSSLFFFCIDGHGNNGV